VFLHQIVPGAADKSYGIHVAQLAGVPRSVNERAREVLAWLESQHQAAQSDARAIAGNSSSPPPSTNGHGDSAAGRWQLTLFGFEEHPLLDEIRSTRLDELSPLAALELVHEWQTRLANEPAPAKR
jgi:DNA mismatch repair protein MutS